MHPSPLCYVTLLSSYPPYHPENRFFRLTPTFGLASSMSGDRSSTGKITLASLALPFSKSLGIDGQNKSKGTIKGCLAAIASRCHRSAKWSDDLTMGFLIPILRTSVLQNMSSQENVQKLFFGVLRNTISLLPLLPPHLNVTKVTHLAYSPSPTPALRNISMAPKILYLEPGQMCTRYDLRIITRKETLRSSEFFGFSRKLSPRNPIFYH